MLVVYLLSLKNCEAIGQVKGKRRSGRPKILSTLVKQYLKVLSLKTQEELTHDLRDVIIEAWGTVPFL